MAYRALVADDHELFREQLCGCIDDTGISVDAAACGEDAVRMAGAAFYDVIFMDNDMGEMHIKGIEAARMIREFDRKALIYLVSADKISPEQIAEAGISGKIDKDGFICESIDRVISALLQCAPRQG